MLAGDWSADSVAAMSLAETVAGRGGTFDRTEAIAEMAANIEPGPTLRSRRRAEGQQRGTLGAAQAACQGCGDGPPRRRHVGVVERIDVIGVQQVLHADVEGDVIVQLPPPEQIDHRVGFPHRRGPEIAVRYQRREALIHIGDAAAQREAIFKEAGAGGVTEAVKRGGIDW